MIPPAWRPAYVHRKSWAFEKWAETGYPLPTHFSVCHIALSSGVSRSNGHLDIILNTRLRPVDQSRLVDQASDTLEELFG